MGGETGTGISEKGREELRKEKIIERFGEENYLKYITSPKSEEGVNRNFSYFLENVDKYIKGVENYIDLIIEDSNLNSRSPARSINGNVNRIRLILTKDNGEEIELFKGSEFSEDNYKEKLERQKYK